MGPEDAIESKTDLIQFLQTPAADLSTSAYLEWTYKDDGITPEHLESAKQAMEKITTYEIGLSDTYWVAPNMVDLLVQASANMPAQALDRDHLPSPVGFIYFSRPLIVPAMPDDDEGDESPTRRRLYARYGKHDGDLIWKRERLVNLRAFLWADLDTIFNSMGAEREGDRLPGVVLTVFSTASDIFMEMPQDLSDKTRRELQSFEKDIPKWLILDNYMWHYGQDWATIGKARGPSGEWVTRVVGSFWTLVDQELTDVTRRPAPRPFARRAERVGLPSSEIKVVTLRRRHTHSDGDGDSSVDWSHQWVVDGHWRNQPWGPGHTKRRLQYIAPYVKGPEGKPLLLKETVYSWRR